MTGNEPRRVIGRRTGCGNYRRIEKAVDGADEALATIHNSRQEFHRSGHPHKFDVHGFGIEIVQIDLNVK